MRRKSEKLICCVMAAILCFIAVPVPEALAEVTNNTKETALAIEADKDTEGILKDGEVAWYQYTVEETGYIEVSLKEAKEVDYAVPFWDLTVLVDNKKLLDDVYTGSEFASAKFGLKKGTKVYFMVEGSNNSRETPYIINVKNTKSAYWEKEFNDKKSTATVIKANKKYFGNSYYGYPSSDAEKDYFMFKSTKKGTLKVYFGNSEMDTSSSFQTKIYVNSKLKESTSSRDYFGRIAKLNVKKGDKVYIIVTAYDSGVDYALKVKY